MGAVIANAVYDAIGVRLYELPMTPARVKKDKSKSHPIDNRLIIITVIATFLVRNSF
jgi:hypothetical protein